MNIAPGTLCLIVDGGGTWLEWERQFIGATCTVTGPLQITSFYMYPMYPVECPTFPNVITVTPRSLRPLTPPPEKIDTRVPQEETA